MNCSLGRRVLQFYIDEGFHRREKVQQFRRDVDDMLQLGGDLCFLDRFVAGWFVLVVRRRLSDQEYLIAFVTEPAKFEGTYTNELG